MDQGSATDTVVSASSVKTETETKTTTIIPRRNTRSNAKEIRDVGKNCSESKSKLPRLAVDETTEKTLPIKEETSPPLSFPCHLCPAEKSRDFIDRHSLSKHLRIIHNHEESNLDSIHCTICFKEFLKEKEFTKHCQTVHADTFKVGKAIGQGKKSHKCPSCCKSFPLKQTMIEHIRISLPCNQSLYKCSRCKEPQYFRLKWHLRIHAKKVHAHWTVRRAKKEKNLTLSCQLCSQTFLDKVLLFQHITVHDSDDPSRLRCDICSQQLEHRTSLKQHLKRAHSRPFLCDVCSRSFKNETLFEKHYLLPPECNSDFGSDSDSDSVIELDSPKGSDDLECQICEERFVTQCLLSVHTDRHLKQLRLREEGTDSKSAIHTATAFT